MIRIFYWVLNMAIVGSLLGGVLLLIRRIKKLPYNFIYALYSLVLFRFLCPLGLTNGFGLLNILPQGTVLKLNPFTGKEAMVGDPFLMSNFMQKAETYQPLKLESNGWYMVYEMGSMIWIVVSAALLLYYGFMYIMAKEEIKKATLLRDNIYQSISVNAPMVVGIIKPRIILPICISEQDDNIPYIIAHENTHIMKRDNLWRLVAIIIACVYWFTPMSWILLKYFLIDMELACDETTIRSYTLENRKQYAAALLAVTQKEPLIYATAFANGSVKLRIKCVLNYKQATVLSTIFLFVLFVLFIFIFLSN